VSDTKGDKHVEIYDSIRVSDSLQIGVRDYLSLSHIWGGLLLLPMPRLCWSLFS
jgi:hypothetical protein